MVSGDTRTALALRINDRVFYGWVVLAVAAIGLFASGPGQSHMFSVFLTPIGQDLGISYTAISTAYAIATVIAATGLPYMGRLVDRFGARRVMLMVTLLLGAASLAFGWVVNMVALGVGFTALRFLGQGSLMLNCANLVSQWFSKKRGFALSLMALGFAASMAAHPPLAQWLIDQVGWRQAWLWLGVITWVLMIPLVVLFVHNKPEDLGLEPDGSRETQDTPGWSGAAASHGADVGLTSGQATRTPAFWIIAVSLATLSMLVTALFFHQVSIFESHDLSAQLAARVFSISAITMVLAMPLIGRMLDRFATQPIFACAMLTMTVALVAAMIVQNVATAIVYSVFFGIANAAIQTHYMYLWPRFFGRRHLGSIQGTGQTISIFGASLGPIPLGAAYDLTGSYTVALGALAIIPVLCAIAILLMKPPRLEDYRAEPAAAGGAS